jgi:hypothetical protein
MEPDDKHKFLSDGTNPDFSQQVITPFNLYGEKSLGLRWCSASALHFRLPKALRASAP